MRIVVVYIVFAASWIAFSDQVLGWLVADAHVMVQWAIFKGLIFVLVTGILLYSLISRHLSRLKKAHQLLSESEMKYRELVESANSIILSFDKEGRIRFLNKYALTFFGFEEREILGRPMVGTIVPAHDSSGRDLAAMINEIIQYPDKYATNHNENMLRNGKKAWIAWTNRPILDAQGQFVEILSVGNDITRQMQLEQQYIQMQKMESVGRLAGGIAHDFNNILTAILGSASLVLRNRGLDTDGKEEVNEICKSVQRASALTKQLLAFARRQENEPCVINLNELILNLTNMLKVLVGTCVEIQMDLAPDIGLVKADRIQLEQVLVNLSVNARDAMPQGGTVTIRTVNKAVHEIYVPMHLEIQPGEYIVVSVSDTGTGIDEEVQKHLFEPFFTTKEKGKGTGLGLSTCFGIVRQNSGFIDFSSEQGKGTTFRVYLPRLPDVETKSNLKQLN